MAAGKRESIGFVVMLEDKDVAGVYRMTGSLLNDAGACVKFVRENPDMFLEGTYVIAQLKKRFSVGTSMVRKVSIKSVDSPLPKM